MSDVPNLRIRVITSPDQVAEFWEWLTRPDRRMVACDLETTGLDWWSPGFRIRLAQFGDTDGGWAIPYQGWPALVHGALDWCSYHRVPVVFHNGIGFDALAFRSQGYHLDWTNLEDTFVWAAVTGWADQDRMLKHLAVREFGGWAAAGDRVLKAGMKNAGWDWATVPMDWKPYPMYGVVDTCITAGLWEAWEPRRARWANDHALEVATARIVNDMMWNGTGTDGDYLFQEIVGHQEREEEIEAQLKALGITNPAQNGQLELVLQKDGYPLAEKTASGKAKLDKDVLAHIDHPAAKLVLEHRWVHRVVTSYLQPIFEGAGGQLGRGILHPNIKPIEARTGRMSVEHPPLQQLPSGDPVVRQGIIGRSDDDVVISSDFGQIELRLWGSINNDQPMLDALKNADATGGDFFVELGKTIYGEPDFVKKDHRRTLLKSTVYAKLFGGGIETAAATAGVNV